MRPKTPAGIPRGRAEYNPDVPHCHFVQISILDDKEEMRSERTEEGIICERK
jgi:hypothetical protein